MPVQLTRRFRTSQPTRHVGINEAHPSAFKVLDGWLAHSMQFRSCRGRAPNAIVDAVLTKGLFGVGISAKSGGSSIKYNVGAWGQSGSFAFLAVCEFIEYTSNYSIVRRDGACTPVQIAASIVRAVPWAPIDIGKYYFSAPPSGVKRVVLIANRVSQSTFELWSSEAGKVTTTTALTGYGTTSNPLCFMGTESNTELATSSSAKFYGGVAFKKGLTDAEIKSFLQNPWQLFAPEPIPLFWSGAAVGRTATASLSAAIRSGQSMTASASAVISVANTATVSASAAIRADHSATASVSAAIRSDRTASASLNAAIQSAATASATLSGAIQTAQSATSGLAAYIVASSARSESAVLSAAISDARTATSSLSAAVAAARTATATLDSAVQIEATASTGVSAAIREAVSLSANLSGAVQASATASASLAAVVAKTNALSSGLSAAVRAEQTAFAALSAYIAADVVLTQAEVDMLTDIWQRFGLDPLAPLTETETSASFGGIVLSKSGTNTITSTRSGDSAAGVASSMILDVWQRLGLDPDNPMTASETQISAGALSQARAVSGATVTVTRTP